MSVDSEVVAAVHGREDDALQFLRTVLPSARLGFPVEGCTVRDLVPWRGAVRAAAARAETLPQGWAWKSVADFDCQQPPSPGALSSRAPAGPEPWRAEVDGIVRALAASGTSGAAQGLHAQVHALPSAEGDDPHGVYAGLEGLRTGSAIGMLTRLRGSRFQATLTPSAVAHHSAFATAVSREQLASDSDDQGTGGNKVATAECGAMFDRWLHSTLRWLKPHETCGNVETVSIAAVTLPSGPFKADCGIRPPPTVWLFAIAYVSQDVPPGGKLWLADAPGTCKAIPGKGTKKTWQVDDAISDLMPTDDESLDGSPLSQLYATAENAEPNVCEIPCGAGALHTPIIDLCESQQDEQPAKASNECGIPCSPLLEDNDNRSDVGITDPGALPVARRRAINGKQATWKDVIHHVPTPVAWVDHVRQQVSGLGEAVDRINNSARPLRLGTPCAGFEAPFFALRELGVTNLEHAFSADIAPHAATFGSNLRRAENRGQSRQDGAFFGKTEGDLLSMDFSEVPSLHLLVAGPPCPPWSRMGSRNGRQDGRAHVFWRVIDLLGELSNRSGEEALRCFVLENVQGIMQYDAHHHRGIEEVLERLDQVVPGFQLKVLQVNSKDFSLPQNRPRVYIVGVREGLLLPGRALCDPLKHPKAPTFSRWLVPASQARKACPLMCEVPARLRQKKRKFDQQLDEIDRKERRCGNPWGWREACTNIERDVENRWAAKVKADGLIGTVTTGNTLWLWVRQCPDRPTAVSSCIGGAPAMASVEERYLMPIESLAMQGFPMNSPLLKKALDGLSDADVLFGAGNAMSVPVVGAILADVLAKTELLPSAPQPAARSIPLVVIEDSAESLEEEHQAALPAHVGASVPPPEGAQRLGPHRFWATAPPPLRPVVLEASRFACGCWLHLRKIGHAALDAQGVQTVHASTDRLLLGRDPRRVPAEGLLVGAMQGDRVSRVHAELRREGVGRGRLLDCSSSNGTFVVGRGSVDTEGETLRQGDVVAFGAGRGLNVEGWELWDQRDRYELLFRVDVPG